MALTIGEIRRCKSRAAARMAGSTTFLARAAIGRMTQFTGAIRSCLGLGGRLLDRIIKALQDSKDSKFLPIQHLSLKKAC
jgi:hypothetical protein